MGWERRATGRKGEWMSKDGSGVEGRARWRHFHFAAQDSATGQWGHTVAPWRVLLIWAELKSHDGARSQMVDPRATAEQLQLKSTRQVVGVGGWKPAQGKRRSPGIAFVASASHGYGKWLQFRYAPTVGLRARYP